jgi:hypothetical protein
MSNVRPLAFPRGRVTLPSAFHCFGRASSSRASARPLALPSHGSLSGPSFGLAARERAVRHPIVFRGQSGSSGFSLKEQIQSLGLRCVGLESSGVQARSAQQFNRRPNRSIERTRNGRPRYARSSFSAPRGLPSRASHVKRYATEECPSSQQIELPRWREPGARSVSSATRHGRGITQQSQPPWQISPFSPSPLCFYSSPPTT